MQHQNPSRDSIVTEKSSKSDVSWIHSKEAGSTRSDFVHYLVKSTKIPMGVKAILFTVLIAQWLLASLCPSFDVFWTHDPNVDKMLTLASYVCLIRPPPIYSSSFRPILITIYVLVGIEALLSSSMQLYYGTRRYLNNFSCYVLVYLDLLVDVLLFPFICAISGMYLSASFLEPDQTSQALVVLDLLVFVYVVGNSASFHLFMNFTVSWNELFCFTWRQDVSVRLYLSLGFVTFLSEAMVQRGADARVLSGVVCAVCFANMVFEIVQINWLIDWQFRLMGAAMITCFAHSVLLVVNTCIPWWNEPTMVIWIGVVVFLGGWLALPVYLRIMTKRATKDLDKEDYADNVSSCFRALRDHSLGFQSDHEKVMNCTHIPELLLKYPSNVNLYIFLARLSLECNTCPISLDEIADRILPKDSFAPIQTHAFVSLTRLMPPMSEREMENYNKLVMTIRHGLFRLLGAARHVFDMILDEITSTLPPAALSFEAIYNKTIFRLFQFVQRYPGSPDGEYFLNLMESILPDAPELKELKQWHNYHPDYVKIATSVCHSHLHARLKNPDHFRSYHPDYQTPPAPDIDPLVVEQVEDDAQKTKKTRGPYEHLVRKWYVYLILMVGLLLPVCFAPVMIAQTQGFLDKTNHFIDAWALRWRLDRVITLTYPTIFYSSSNETWNEFSVGLMDYEAWKAYFLSELKTIQAAFIRASTGYGDGMAVDQTIMEAFAKIFSQETTSPLIPGTFSYDHGILACTFMFDEILSRDPIYMRDLDNITYLVWVLDEAVKLIDECFERGKPLAPNNIVFSNKLFALSPVIALVVLLVLLVGALCFISVMFYKAISRSNLFFMTLRETSKSAVAHVRSYFLKQQDSIGTTITAKQKTIKKRMFRYFLDFLIPFLILSAGMITTIVLSYSLYVCFNSQIERVVQFNDFITESYVNLSRAARNHQKIVFADQIGNVDVEALAADIEETFCYWMPYSNLWGDDGTSFCPHCTLRYQLLAPMRDGTYERILMSWISAVTLYVNLSLEQTFLDTIASNVSSSYYFETEGVMIDFCEQLFRKSYSMMYQTRLHQFVVYFVYIILVGCMVVLFVATVARADAPFQQMVRLLNRLPEKSLSRDTLRILKEDFWDFRADEFEFDPSYYDKVLSILPDAVIVIDQTRSILSYNEAAETLISAKGGTAVGRNLFESMTMKLREANNETGPDEPTLGFQDLVNDYLFDDRSTVPTHKLMGKKNHQSYWWSLTILPVFDESPDQVVSQLHGAENFALIFRDIGEEIRQQNLLEEETEKHMSIVKQILPPEIAARLLNEQRSISMTVEKVAISFCDIVEFTPWCASQTPEFVVNALNCMFKKFDDLCTRYSQVTKIKCIGDCYMSAAGVFAHGVDPSVAAHQMILFCLDSIEGIKAVNKVLNTSLRVRIGIAYGGPISAGVMGIHKPVFDIWGETVNDAQAMESSGEPMKVHISKAMYEVVKDTPCHFQLREDGTALASREVPEVPPEVKPEPEAEPEEDQDTLPQAQSDSESAMLLGSDELDEY